MPGQSFRGKLSERQTTNILDVASRAPAENARRIIGDGQRIIGIQAPGNPALVSCLSAHLSNVETKIHKAAFGVTINSEMVVTRGRILAPPPVLYRAGATLIPDGASWNMRGRQFAIAKPMRDWAVLRLGNAVITPEQTLEFRQTLNACGLGLQVSRFPLGYTAALPGTEDANDMSIRNVLEKITKAGVHMLLVVLPTKNAATYNRVKFWADVKFGKLLLSSVFSRCNDHCLGVHTVCVIADKLTTVKQLSQYFANVALKINQKYGGTNSIINKDKLGFLKDGDTMVVGYDVTHPAPGSLVGIPSIAGVVASIDGLYGQWPGSIRCQESKKEMVAELRLMMKERLQLWVAKNQRKPNKIIIFRWVKADEHYYNTDVSISETASPRVNTRLSLSKSCRKFEGHAQKCMENVRSPRSTF